MQDHLIRTNNTWPIRQIEFYDSNNSHRFTSKNGEALCMRDVGNFLILYAEETILGTIPIGPGSNVTAFYTGDCMSFKETQNNIEKTVKIQLSGSQEDFRNFVFRIQQCINVSRTEEHDEISKNYKIAELLKNNPMDAITDVNPMLPTNYPLEDAVKLCLADPKFPALVENVSQVLKRLAQSGTQTGYEV